jgi:hypothetical protein
MLILVHNPKYQYWNLFSIYLCTLIRWGRDIDFFLCTHNDECLKNVVAGTAVMLLILVWQPEVKILSISVLLRYNSLAEYNISLSS